MKKRSIILGIVALALVLVGTGYAYWTDTLNVTTVANTGDLDVTFADLGLYAQYGNEYYNGNWSIIDGIGADGYIPANYFERGTTDYNAIAKSGTIVWDADLGAFKVVGRDAGYNNVGFDAKLVDALPITATVGPYNPNNAKGSDNILLTVKNIYPGYAQTFRTDILNVGTMAAKLSNIKFEAAGANETILDMLGIAVLIEREYQVQGEEGVDVFDLCSALNGNDFFEVGGVHFIRLSSLDNIDMDVINNANLLATPNENRMDLYMAIAMDPDAEGEYTTGTAADIKDNDDSLSQKAAATVSMDLIWGQFNEGFEVDSVNRLIEQNHDTRVN